MTTEDTPIKPWYVVRRSKLHGNGVFALVDIPAGTELIEYRGRRLTHAQADRRYAGSSDRE